MRLSHGGVSKFPLSAAGESSLRFTPQHIKYSAKWGNQRKNYPKGGGHADTSLSRHGGRWTGADQFRRVQNFGRRHRFARRPPGGRPPQTPPPLAAAPEAPAQTPLSAPALTHPPPKF